MPDQPRIGVTRWEDVPPEARDRYWSRVREAGGEVVDLDESAAARVAELAPSLDGLLLTGGVDVDPSCYSADRHPKVKETSHERDLMELAYLDAALARDIPVLAICRGHQLLNVGFGGTLVQHIDSGEHRADFRTEGYPSRWHDVRLLPDTRLARAFGGETAFEINSRHHQGVQVATLGAGLRPTAASWSRRPRASSTAGASACSGTPSASRSTAPRSPPSCACCSRTSSARL
jgi:putative glutamine amidotransferase